MGNVTEVVKNLIIINVLMFIGTMALPGEWRAMLMMYFPLSEFFKPFQLVTHMFMHGDLMHLFFNMWGLYLFGSALEALWGSKKFLFYYFFTGFGAAFLYLFVKYIEYQYALSTLDPMMVQEVLKSGGELIAQGRNYTNPDLGGFNALLNAPALGASGSIFGLLAGYGMSFPNNKLMIFPLPFALEAKYFVIIYGALELYLGLSGFNTGVAHFAHLGGALFGLLIILYWRKTGNMV